MPVGSRDYYEVLGVNRRASDDEIRTAYRKLAKKWHPDRHQGGESNKAETKFKEINEAYEVLSEPDKRTKYDRFGSLFHSMDPTKTARGTRSRAGTGPFGTGQGFEDLFRSGSFAGSASGSASGGEGRGFGTILEDLFEELFKKEDRGGGFGGRPTGSEAMVELTLEEAHGGGRKRLAVSQAMPCLVCHGERHVRGQLCAGCGGGGYRNQERTLDVNFPSGVREGSRLKVGDLSLVVRLRKHAIFDIEGDDLKIDLPLFPHEAALGKDIEVPTIDGSVRVSIPQGTSSGKTLRLRGKGLARRDGGLGDLYARVIIVFPASLSEEERRLYKQLDLISRENPRTELNRRAKAASA